MAESTRYHIIPEDNRPSMETLAGDNERELLLEHRDDDTIPPKKGAKEVKFTYHPTFIIRLFVLVLFIIASIFLLVSHRSQSVAAIVFLFVAIFRNFLVLTQHSFSRWIRIHIEIVGKTSTTSKPKTRHPSLPIRRRVQVAIDLTLVALLTITSVIAEKVGHHWWYSPPDLVLPACILCWIALPGYALATLDMGKPSRITIGSSISIDLSNKSDGEEAVPRQTYRDVEASGGLGGKTRADSPTII